MKPRRGHSPLSVRQDTTMSMKPGGISIPPSTVLQSLTEAPKPRLLKLRFINSPPRIIYTNTRIKAKDDSPIAIELIDASTNTRVTLDLRLEIVALNADITEKESWTTKKFNQNILRSREGGRPLLVGDLIVKLKDGVGVLGDDVTFTDTSSWLTSRKFRLGAKAIAAKVGEAITKPFMCKDTEISHRKHYPPYPDTEVWRLDKIAKNSSTESRLALAGIHTVKDLRRHLAIKSNAVPQVLEERISEKRWNAIVSHSMQCVLDESECYVYNSETHGSSLLFNSFYEIIKVSFDGITALNTADLTATQEVR